MDIDISDIQLKYTENTEKSENKKVKLLGGINKMDKVFGRRLKELREEKDMKQSDLAKILECSSSAIGMYEQGRRYVDLDGLKKIAEYFDVSADYLIGRTDIKKFEDFPPEVKRVANLFSSIEKSKADSLEKLIRELLKK